MSTIKELIELAEAGGEIRAFAILGACRQVVSEHARPTVERVTAACAALPNFGEAVQDEIDCAMGIIDAEAQAHADALEQPDAESVRPGADTATIIEAEPPTLDRETALANLNAANTALADARTAVTAATRKRNDSRATLATSLQAWVSGLPKMDRTTAVKQAIASYQADKQARADAGVPQYAKRTGNSYFDRAGSYRGDATTFVMKQHRRGGKRFGRGDVMGKDGRIMRLPSDR